MGELTENWRLKTCPFCGKKPGLQNAANTVNWWIVTCRYSDCKVMPTCQMQGLDTVIAAWNERAA